MRHTLREEQEGKNIYTVYLVRCKVNGKGYVGQTTQKNLNVRFNNGWGYKGNSKFFADIQKYGWKEGFEHKVYATNLTSEEADKLEQEIIEQYNLTDSEYGYNRLTGGKEAGTIKYGDEYLKDSPKNRGSWSKGSGIGNFIDPEGNLHENVSRAYVGRCHKDWIRIKSAEELEKEAKKQDWHDRVERNKIKKAEYAEQSRIRKAEKSRRKAEREFQEKTDAINRHRLDALLAALGYRLKIDLRPTFVKTILKDLKYIHSKVKEGTGLTRKDLQVVSLRTVWICLYTGYIEKTNGKPTKYAAEYCSKILERI